MNLIRTAVLLALMTALFMGVGYLIGGGGGMVIAFLIAAGLKLFGQKGFAATSTREIAAEAGANIASIAYHFGNKDGLRLACGHEVRRRIGGTVAAVLEGPADAPPPSPDEAMMQIEAAIRAMTAFLLTERAAEDVVPFMLREVAENGANLDMLYDGMILPAHVLVEGDRIAAATGNAPDSEHTRLMVFSAIGQILYFRIGRPIVERRLGWAEWGTERARQTADVIVSNVRAMIERERRP